jgi:hypothetical protein
MYPRVGKLVALRHVRGTLLTWRGLLRIVSYDVPISVSSNEQGRYLQNTYRPSNLSSTNSDHPSTGPVQPGQQYRHPHLAQSGLLQLLRQVVPSRR